MLQRRPRCIILPKLSLEWAHQGVLVNTVAPCITETESRKNILGRPGYGGGGSGAAQGMIPREDGISLKTSSEQ